jgi:DNA polymerase-3 subunit beta
MQTLPASEFPTPASETDTAVASLPGSALKRMISHTRFRITSEDTRYFLNGAQLVLAPDSMSMVATDGHRLAFVRVMESPGKGAKSEVLLPRKTLNEVARLIDGADSIEFSQGENHLFFRAGSRLLISRKIDANFPGLRAGDSEVERQEHRVRSRSAGGLRYGGSGCCRTNARKR